MKEKFRRMPTKAPRDFLVPLEALKSVQSQDVMKKLSPQFPLYNLKEMIP